MACMSERWVEIGNKGSGTDRTNSCQSAQQLVAVSGSLFKVIQLLSPVCGAILGTGSCTVQRRYLFSDLRGTAQNACADVDVCRTVKILRTLQIRRSATWFSVRAQT